jgi:ferredoxin--NADP+ reductase
MVATGTGIAPFRSYVRRFFCEDVPNYNFKGLAWLFMGVANSDAKLYDDEFQALLARYPDQFRLDYALSREQNNRKGGKMYIQDKVEEYKDQVFDLMNNGAHMYFCGLKGMMPGILDMLEGVCKEKGLNFEEWLEGLKHKVRKRRGQCRCLHAPRLRSAACQRGMRAAAALLDGARHARCFLLRGQRFGGVRAWKRP